MGFCLVLGLGSKHLKGGICGDYTGDYSRAY